MTLTLPAGTTLDDRYEILSVAGSGGMGTVYRAKQIGLGREVAVKVLDPALLGEGDNYERFEREAKSISLAQHEHIATFYNFGILNSTMPYLAMEYLSGPSLREIINNDSPIPWQRAFEICAQICEGMEAAHQAGVVHRDLKPNNVIIMDKPKADFVKIVDFGLAKLSTTTSGNHKLTVTGQLIGSVNYLSPEQCLGRQSDERSDIYSLGCILYELITGLPPFEHENPVAMLHAHMSETPIKPSKRVDISKSQSDSGSNKQAISGALPGSGEISKQIKKKQLEKIWLNIDSIVSKAMAKDPASRYESMKEFEYDLRAVLSGEQENLVARTGSIVPESKADEAKAKALASTLGISMAILLALAGSITAWLYFSDEGQTQRGLFALEGGGKGNKKELLELLLKSEKLQSEGKKKLANQITQTVLLTIKRKDPDPLALGRLYLDCAKTLLSKGDSEGAKKFAYDAMLALIKFDSKELINVNDYRLKQSMQQTVSVARDTKLKLNRAQAKELQFLLGALDANRINFANLSDLYDLLIESGSTHTDLAKALTTRDIALIHKGYLTRKEVDQVVTFTRKAYGKDSPETAHNCVSILKTIRDYSQRDPHIHEYVMHLTISEIESCKVSDPNEKLSMLFDVVHIGYDYNLIDDANRGTKLIESIISSDPDYGPRHAELDLLMGRLEHANKNYEKSSKLFDRAIKFAFESKLVRYDMLQRPVLEQAVNLEHLGKPDEAIKLVQTYLKTAENLIDGTPDALNSGSTFHKDNLANSGLLVSDFFASNNHQELVLPTLIDSVRVCNKYGLAGARTLWSIRRLLIELERQKKWLAAIPYVREEVETDDSFYEVTPETMSILANSSIYQRLQRLDPSLYKQATEKILRVLLRSIELKHTTGTGLHSVIASLAKNGEKEDAAKLLKEALNRLPENDDEYIAIKKRQKELEMLLR